MASVTASAGSAHIAAAASVAMAKASVLSMTIIRVTRPSSGVVWICSSISSWPVAGLVRRRAGSITAPCRALRGQQEESFTLPFLPKPYHLFNGSLWTSTERRQRIPRYQHHLLVQQVVVAILTEQF